MIAVGLAPQLRCGVDGLGSAFTGSSHPWYINRLFLTVGNSVQIFFALSSIWEPRELSLSF
ncbi:hypothetical protein M413DRAFT_449723 [Hebeloma cylindrosporum]|uniref:Uncharacterized protein n=1 Tax=Hebeloma cylindrosporum TaxID=76867 RepID=A0A0C2Y357_HEBCY|nr:hypothetical protein M413DRAFT_449723 [Hebeloma cylindrosporum h7]